MLKADSPTVFVSSTCYDLKQVRADIRGFIESLGFNPMLSEYSSFPIDPDIGTVENCLKAVDEYATIFVLIVGGRYGAPTDEGKSVTNLEYLRGRAKGIPVYAFVQRSILDILPVWRANPDANFQQVADSTKLFEFVAGLRDSRDVWVLPFDTAQDITETLRTQWAYLFLDALQLRLRAKQAGLPDSLAQLKGQTLRLVIEQPLLWEIRLFSEVLAQELSEARHLRRDLDYGVVFGTGERFDVSTVWDLLQRKNTEMIRVISSLERLINVALSDAMKPPGVPADAEGIVYVARKVGESYRHMIQWTIDYRRIDVDEELQNLITISSRMSTNAVREVEEFSQTLQSTIVKEIAEHKPGVPRTITFKLTITAPPAEEVIEEMNRVRRVYGF